MYAVLNPTTMNVYPDVPDLETCQALVGGYVECVASAPSLIRPGINLVAYANDEGRLLPLTVHYVRRADNVHIHGVIVLSAWTGEGVTVSATLPELEALAALFRRVP